MINKALGLRDKTQSSLRFTTNKALGLIYKTQSNIVGKFKHRSFSKKQLITIYQPQIKRVNIHEKDVNNRHTGR